MPSVQVPDIRIDGLGAVGQLSLEDESINWHSSNTVTKISLSDISSCSWMAIASSFQVRVHLKSCASVRMDGFKEIEAVAAYLKSKSIPVEEERLSAVGGNWGDYALTGSEGSRNFGFKMGDQLVFDFPMSDLAQAVNPNRTLDVDVAFNEESRSNDPTTDVVTSIVFTIPPSEDRTDRLNEATKLLQKFKENMVVKNDATPIVQLDQSFGSFVIPRAHYSIEFFDNHCRLQGQTYTHNVQYKKISSFYMLPEVDNYHVSLVIALTEGIRQGNQFYPNLVMQFGSEDRTAYLNLTDEELATRFPKLSAVMTGKVNEVVAKLFRHITGKKVFIPESFHSTAQKPCIKCSYGTNTGMLYLMETCFIFIHKPTLFIRYEDCRDVTVRRLAKVDGGNNTFDLIVTTRDASNYKGSTKVYLFSTIDRAEFDNLEIFLRGKELKVFKPQEGPAVDDASDDSEEEMGARSGGEDEGEEEDSDFNEKAAIEVSGKSSSSSSPDASDKEA